MTFFFNVTHTRHYAKSEQPYSQGVLRELHFDYLSYTLISINYVIYNQILTLLPSDKFRISRQRAKNNITYIDIALSESLVCTDTIRMKIITLIIRYTYK